MKREDGDRGALCPVYLGSGHLRWGGFRLDCLPQYEFMVHDPTDFEAIGADLRITSPGIEFLGPVVFTPDPDPDVLGPPRQDPARGLIEQPPAQSRALPRFQKIDTLHLP